jgi:hypothetical protein
MIDIKYAELHNPLFLAGTNLQTKLDPSNSKYAAIRMQYDRVEKELLVYWNGVVGIIPSSNIACMIEGLPEIKAPQFTHPIVAGISSAQVETPMSHVHAGFGHGKTGKSK